jgi:hypothetical protein
VPGGVAERLLHDPVGRQLHARRERARLPGHGHGGREPGPAGAVDQLAEVPETRLRRALGGLGVAAQHPEQAAHLVERLAGGLADGGEVAHAVLGQPADPVGGGLGLDRDHGHVVGDDVVQLAGDPGALLQDGPAGLLPTAGLSRVGQGLLGEAACADLVGEG